MLYLVAYNAYYGYGEEWFTKGIFDSKEKADNTARILSNEIIEEYRKKGQLDEETEEDIKEYYVKIIPLTLNQIYKTSNISIDGKDVLDYDNEAYIGGYDE